MTTPTIALCTCGDDQGDHRRGMGGCRVVGCGCSRFVDSGRTATLRPAPVDVPEVAPAPVPGTPVLAARPAEPVVLDLYRSWYCPACHRYYPLQQAHGCGALVLVTVTITTRTAA